MTKQTKVIFFLLILAAIISTPFAVKWTMEEPVYIYVGHGH